MYPIPSKIKDAASRRSTGEPFEKGFQNAVGVCGPESGGYHRKETLQDIQAEISQQLKGPSDESTGAVKGVVAIRQ